MGQDQIHGIVGEGNRGDGEAALGQKEELANGLGDGGFAAAIGAGENIDAFLRIEDKVVGNGLGGGDGAAIPEREEDEE